jgi:arsenate reductase
MMIVYGIKNCDTVKKALNWLKANNKVFEFHDYKKEGITTEKLQSWCSQVGWENLLNRRGTTWRKLDEETRNTVTDETQAMNVMLTNTSIIKRPVIEKDGKVLMVGFDEASYSAKL